MVARRLVLWGLLPLAFMPAAAPAAPADLDRGFGGDGIVRVEGPGGPKFPSDAHARMAVGLDDEIFVLYSNYPPCEPPFDCPVTLSLARYDADGNRDASFGMPPGSQLEVRQFTERRAFDLAVGPDGKPVVAASDHTADGITVARFDRSGHLDGTFGVGGRAPQTLRVATDTPVAVAVQPDGKVVVAAAGSRIEGGQELVLARYLANGEVDTGFGSAGKTVVPLPVQTRPADLLLHPDGAITVAGPFCCVGGTPLFGEGFSIARFLPDGRPDPGLGGSGQLFVPTPGAQGAVVAAALGPDGGLFVDFEERMEALSTVGNVVKLQPDGLAYSTFGHAGRLRLFDRVGAVDSRGMVVDSSGRLVGVGWGDGKVSAFRLRADGSTDRTFNGGRYVTSPTGFTPFAVTLQSAGRILILGNSNCCGSQSFLLIGLRGGNDRSRCQGRKATVVGTRRKDELTGTSHRDVIVALDGNDTVRGLAGADLICGGKGHDRLLGGPGRDSIQQQPGGPVTR